MCLNCTCKRNQLLLTAACMARVCRPVLNIWTLSRCVLTAGAACSGSTEILECRGGIPSVASQGNCSSAIFGRSDLPVEYSARTLTSVCPAKPFKLLNSCCCLFVCFQFLFLNKWQTRFDVVKH